MEKSAEAVVVKKPVERREERRAKEPKRQRSHRKIEESPETAESGAKLSFLCRRKPKTDGCRQQAIVGGKVGQWSKKTKLLKVQPPDAENRTSGGVEGSRGAIPVGPSDRGKDSKIILAAFHFLPFTRTLSLSPYPVMHDIDVDKVIDSVQSLKKDLTEDSDDIKLSES